MYTWCLHCETVHKTENWKMAADPIDEDDKECPVCGASIVLEGWEWDGATAQFVEANGYPEVPEEGKIYPMYPKSEVN